MTIAEIRVIAIDNKQTIVTMILFLLNMRLICFNGPHRKNDLINLRSFNNLPSEAKHSPKGVENRESAHVSSNNREE